MMQHTSHDNKGLHCVFLVCVCLLYPWFLKGQVGAVNDSLQIKEFNDKAETALNSPAKKILFGQKALELNRNTILRFQKAKSHFFIGLGYQELGEYDVSMEHFFKAYNLFKAEADTTWQSMTLDNIGYNYWSFGNYKEAQNYFEQSLSLARLNKDEGRTAVALVNLALSLGSQQLYAKAYANYSQAIAIYEKSNNVSGLSPVYNNIGILKTEEGFFKEAERFFLKSLSIDRRLEKKISEAEVHNNMGNLYLQSGEYSEAEKHLNQAAELIKETSAQSLLLDNLKHKAELYTKQQKFKKALQFQEEYIALYQQTINSQKIDRFVELQTAMKIELKEQEIQLREQEIELLGKEKRLARLQTVLISLVLFFIGLTVFMHLRKKRQLARQEAENLRTENELASTKLRYKNQELTNFALHITQRNEYLDQLKEQLLAIYKKEAPEVQSIKRLVVELGKKIKTNHGLSDFHEHLEKVNQEFFLRLKAAYPDLTENELNLCALLRLNLSSKEIAFLKNTSPKSVDMSRYRLRKKLALEKENLQDFIKGF